MSFDVCLTRDNESGPTVIDKGLTCCGDRHNAPSTPCRAQGARRQVGGITFGSFHVAVKSQACKQNKQAWTSPHPPSRSPDEKFQRQKNNEVISVPVLGCVPRYTRFLSAKEKTKKRRFNPFVRIFRKSAREASSSTQPRTANNKQGCHARRSPIGGAARS